MLFALEMLQLKERFMIDSNLKAEFPGTQGQVYMDTAARGLLPRSTSEAVNAHLSQLVNGNADKSLMFETLERCRARFAALISATPDEIAIVKNISDGLCSIGLALPWQGGDNIVLCSALEHPNNIYPWLNLRDRLGVELRDIPSEDGTMPVAAMIAAMDERTRLVPVTHISFTPGYETDLDLLGAACDRIDALLLVDGAQSAGIVHIDVTKTPMDALAVSTQKGLLGLYGFGFLYCRSAWADRLRPSSLARFGVQIAEDNEAATDLQNYQLARGARRFDLGNYNYPAAIAADRSLELLEEIGTAKIEAHVSKLAHELASGLAERGLPVNASGPALGRSGIVTVGTFGGNGHDRTDDPRIAAVADKLQRGGVRFSIRQGTIRFALHLYNSAADVDSVLDLCTD
jgi:selenocysteine lyase/cysteine desulfurase